MCTGTKFVVSMRAIGKGHASDYWHELNYDNETRKQCIVVYLSIYKTSLEGYAFHGRSHGAQGHERRNGFEKGKEETGARGYQKLRVSINGDIAFQI